MSIHLLHTRILLPANGEMSWFSWTSWMSAFLSWPTSLPGLDSEGTKYVAGMPFSECYLVDFRHKLGIPFKCTLANSFSISFS
ncbi:hypothetical protein BDW72DRAFT_179925 [Aspergillus terricola var. indicus]